MWAKIRASNEQYAALTSFRPITRAEIQRNLADDDSVLIEFMLGKERSYVWIVSATSMASYEIAGRERIEETAKRFYQQISSPQRKNTDNDKRGLSVTRRSGRNRGIDGVAIELSRLLLEPLKDHLGKRRLIIAADGALHYVPFSALPDPATMNNPIEKFAPLIASREIVNVPSASALAVIRRELASRRPAELSGVAVFADPVFGPDERMGNVAAETRERTDPNRGLSIKVQKSAAAVGVSSADESLPRLAGTRREGVQILSYAGARRSLAAFDFSANRELATSQEIARYRYLHFATHGFLNSEHPQLSGLVLSMVDSKGQPRNGFLSSADVYGLRLNADLVVLSACQTGLGKAVRGEGLVGLTRGFMYAGAPRVVVSLWAVDDDATAELMGKFYENMLKRGRRPADALRRAQVEMSKTDRYHAPYFWAGFVLQGDWR